MGGRVEGDLSSADIAGVALLLLALAGEALADRGGICEAGLWAFCRHPNYLCEALLWLAYPVIGLVPGQPLTWLSFIAPMTRIVWFKRDRKRKPVLPVSGDLFA